MQTRGDSLSGERVPFEADGYVYVLAAKGPGSGYRKIGRSRSLGVRLVSLAGQLPFEVELEHAFPCERVVESERALHRRFADKRANGEWFLLEQGDVDFLGRISRMRGADIDVGEVVHVPGLRGSERLTVHVPAELSNWVRDAVYWTPGLTLARLAEEALTVEMERLEAERGEPFPERAGDPHGGRPVK